MNKKIFNTSSAILLGSLILPFVLIPESVSAGQTRQNYNRARNACYGRQLVQAVNPNNNHRQHEDLNERFRNSIIQCKIEGAVSAGVQEVISDDVPLHKPLRRNIPGCIMDAGESLIRNGGNLF